MELALNLVCLLVTCGALLAWTLWRVHSDSTLVPGLGRGLFVICLILVLFLPAISITDDLAQAPAMAEGVKLQDVLKAPEHVVQFVLAVILSFALFSISKAILWRRADTAPNVLEQIYGWTPNIEKRPPPMLVA